MRLQQKVSLVTGVDSEIGRAIAVTPAREGSKIAGCYKPSEQAQETLRSKEFLGGTCALLEVGAAVLFLASDEAKQINGVLLPLIAGRSLPTF